MRLMRSVVLFAVIVTLVGLVGCGVSKDKYESVLNDKIILEEKANVLAKTNDALKKEYDNLLKEKMDISTKFETVTNEKAALKAEYDKILDEKVTARAAYDKLLSDTKLKQ